MTILERKKQEPLNLSSADVKRAIKKAEEFKKMLEKGRTAEEIFEDMVRMIIGHDPQ
jgi:hypothetical protein